MLTVIEKVLFAVLVCIALFLAIKGFKKKADLIKLGEKSDRFEKSVNPLFMLRRVFLQLCVLLERPVTGFFHALIFWGFLIFGFITINHVAEGLFSNFSILGHGFFYKTIIFCANFFALSILVSIIYFLIRRYIVKVSTLDRPSWESLIILIFLSTLMVSFLFQEAFRGFGENSLISLNFASSWIFNNILPANSSLATVVLWERILWWLHILVVMGFGVFIPYSKHLHLVAGPINILFKSEGPLAEIPVKDLESLEQFGTPNIKDLTDKDFLDLFSCAHCGRCDDQCPAYNSGKDLSPKTLLEKLKDELIASADKIKKGDEDLKTLLGKVISENEIWDCTTCGACMAACPMFNEHIPKIIGLRQYGVMMEAKFPKELQNLYKGLENQGNPWGINAQTRADWAKDLNLPLISDKKETDVLLWIGCEGSFDDHNQKNARTLIELLNKTKLDFAFLGNEEKCCGDPARRSGHEYLYQLQAMENIEVLKQYKFNRIVTLCPHGFHVIKNEYPKMGGENYQVMHYTQLLIELIEKGQIKLKSNPNLKITYHDPCYLGRYNEVYDAPRSILKTLSNNNLKEMKQNKKHSFCCGAGGGGMWKEETKGDRINYLRIKHAKETGAEIIVTTCPYCSTMFKDGIAETNTENLNTRDLAELLLENTEA